MKKQTLTLILALIGITSSFAQTKEALKMKYGIWKNCIGNM